MVSFLTAGPDEVRAWTIAKETPAQKAAGKIHSDIERGFIRAEVVTYDDLIAAGGLAEAKKVGKCRLEGKTYPYVPIDVSSDSHPFYTGKQKAVASDGRVAAFNRRFKNLASK